MLVPTIFLASGLALIVVGGNAPESTILAGIAFSIFLVLGYLFWMRPGYREILGRYLQRVESQQDREQAREGWVLLLFELFFVFIMLRVLL